MVTLLLIGALSPGAPYVPAATLIVSPATAALTAAAMVAEQPPVPVGLTQSVAAPTGTGAPSSRQSPSSPTNPTRPKIVPFLFVMRSSSLGETDASSRGHSQPNGDVSHKGLKLERPSSCSRE